MQRTLPGPFAARELGHGVWHLSAGGSAAPQLYLTIPGNVGSGVLKDPGIRRLQLEWRDDGVTVSVTGTHGVGILTASTAIVHEARERLYDGLPLAGFDAQAKQFWKRVFLLIRIPGGRFLLRFLARRKR